MRTIMLLWVGALAAHATLITTSSVTVECVAPLHSSTATETGSEVAIAQASCMSPYHGEVTGTTTATATYGTLTGAVSYEYGGTDNGRGESFASFSAWVTPEISGPAEFVVRYSGWMIYNPGAKSGGWFTLNVNGQQIVQEGLYTLVDPGSIGTTFNFTRTYQGPQVSSGVPYLFNAELEARAWQRRGTIDMTVEVVGLSYLPYTELSQDPVGGQVETIHAPEPATFGALFVLACVLALRALLGERTNLRNEHVNSAAIKPV
jgi:hypothetical protein